MEKLIALEELENMRNHLGSEIFQEGKNRIRVCTGTACVASGAHAIVDTIEREAVEKGVELEVVKTGCQGLCQKGPLMNLEPSGHFYQKVRQTDGGAIVTNLVSGGTPVRHLLYRDASQTEPF